MANSLSLRHDRNYLEEEEEEEEDYSELEDSDSEDSYSDDSEEDPTYNHDLEKVSSKVFKLSIKSRSNSRNGRDYTEMDIGDGENSDMEQMTAPKLDKKDMKNLEQVQKIIDAGQVENLKVEQCKMYLRNHGLRLTGKKDILIQRIKEHVEILNGGGEKKYPATSFVLNCKGDACMGDIVMFEQTVYEGYNIVSRSACGPPCGKRTVAGRIVKESYGAAKQQHTFTVEVLWSKGDKPLPPLHPLLIKGRNLYRLNTLRQRWEDEAERQRVLNEKHRRGSTARSNREARIQERIAKKMLKGVRAFPKECNNSHQQKNIMHRTEHKSTLKQGNEAQQKHLVVGQTQQPKPSQKPNPKVPEEDKGNPHSQPLLHNKPNMPASRLYQESTLHHSKPAEPTYQSRFMQARQDIRNRQYVEYKENVCAPVSKPHSFQLQRSNMSTFHFNLEPRSYLTECGNSMMPTRGNMNMSLLHKSQHSQHEFSTINLYQGNHQREPLVVSQNFNHSNVPLQRPTHTKQQLCRYYPQRRCHYGNNCKFSHDLNRNNR